jgi:hypothetical protein
MSGMDRLFTLTTVTLGLVGYGCALVFGNAGGERIRLAVSRKIRRKG